MAENAQLADVGVKSLVLIGSAPAGEHSVVPEESTPGHCRSTLMTSRERIDGLSVTRIPRSSDDGLPNCEMLAGGLRAVDQLNSTSLDWALAHISKFGDTDLFPVPFEFEAIRAYWPALKAESSAPRIWTSTGRGRPNRYSCPGKSRIGFRVSTQLDPLDSLSYAAILYDVCRQNRKV